MNSKLKNSKVDVCDSLLQVSPRVGIGRIRNKRFRLAEGVAAL